MIRKGQAVHQHVVPRSSRACSHVIDTSTWNQTQLPHVWVASCCNVLAPVPKAAPARPVTGELPLPKGKTGLRARIREVVGFAFQFHLVEPLELIHEAQLDRDKK